MVKLLALVALVAGCEASLGGDPVDNAIGVDAAGSGSPEIDAAVASIDAEAPACASGRKLYLNFDGVTLAQATASDSATGKAGWLTNGTAAVPAWRQGSGTRATEITEVVDGVKARLSTTPIDVVTTRPATGPYVMIVLGGNNTGNGGVVGTQYAYATSSHDCGDTIKSDVGWVSNMNGSSTELVADLVIGAVGWGIGLDGTTDTADCMCGWASSCTNAAGACTLNANIATAITGGVESACPGQNPQNTTAAFTSGFCSL